MYWQEWQNALKWLPQTCMHHRHKQYSTTKRNLLPELLQHKIFWILQIFHGKLIPEQVADEFWAVNSLTDISSNDFYENYDYNCWQTKTICSLIWLEASTNTDKKHLKHGLDNKHRQRQPKNKLEKWILHCIALRYIWNHIMI